MIKYINKFCATALESRHTFLNKHTELFNNEYILKNTISSGLYVVYSLLTFYLGSGRDIFGPRQNIRGDSKFNKLFMVFDRHPILV